MAGNPFRRPQAVSASSSSLDSANFTSQSSDITPKPRKVVKRVRIQSPVVSPDEPQDDPFDTRLNPDGHPGSPLPLDVEPDIAGEMKRSFIDSIAQGNSTLNRDVIGDTPPQSDIGGISTERLATRAAQQAPYNPFQRTLASIEQGYGYSSENRGIPTITDRPLLQTATLGASASGKSLMDVDAFTKMLLTGSRENSGSSTPTSATNLSSATVTPGAMSSSNSSFFESILPPQSESPRTSFDDPVIESNHNNGSYAEPPPTKPITAQSHNRPAARKGPQTVSFSDFDAAFEDQRALDSTMLRSSAKEASRPTPSRSLSDLNKPLPLPPTSLDSPERRPEVPIKDEEIEPVPDSPVDVTPPLLVRRPPPAPPIARRSSQMTTLLSGNRTRSGSNLSRSSISDNDETPRKPAPPPTRRPGAATVPSNVTSQAILTAENGYSAAENSHSPASKAPPPPPQRGARRPSPAVTRTPSTQSTASLNIGTRRPSPSLAPPPPPPRRGEARKTSLDAPRLSSDSRRPSDSSHRSSTELRRLSGASWNSGRTPSITSLQHVQEDDHGQIERADLDPKRNGSQASSIDILADMSALQQEIDDLRTRGGRAS